MNTQTTSPTPRRNRSASKRAPSRAHGKLRAAGLAAFNKRYQAALILAGAAAMAIGIKIGDMILEANKKYDGECAVVAQIDKTHDVVVCVRGIMEQYPDAPPAPARREPGTTA
jgi:hypothetical protein